MQTKLSVPIELRVPMTLLALKCRPRAPRMRSRIDWARCLASYLLNVLEAQWRRDAERLAKLLQC